MPIRAQLFAFVFVIGPFAAPALMAMEPAKVPQRLTIYANGLTLVDEARTLHPTGDETLRIDHVSPQMLADSVEVALPDGPGVHEIALDSDLLTERALLERALGKTVRVVRTNPATGVETTEIAEVLSVHDGLVLKIGERIETTVPGRLVFEDVPDDLTAEPTLTLRLAEPIRAPIAATLAYLTGGLSWQAVYTAVLSPSHDLMDLTGWARVTNNSGVDFGPAALSVVAGEVNRVSPAPAGKILMRAESMATAADAMSGRAPRNELSAFQLYRLPGVVHLPNRGAKRLRLLDGRGAVTERVLEYRGGAPVFGPVRGDTEPQHVQLSLRFVNDVASHLGEPLPAGLVRAYVRDTENRLRFVGEDRIGNTPVGGDVTLDLGHAFDVTVSRTQTDFKHVADRVTEAAFTLSVMNGGPEPASVNVIEDIPGDWEILDENAVHGRDGAAATWTVAVPANGKTDLTYRVRVRR